VKRPTTGMVPCGPVEYPELHTRRAQVAFLRPIPPLAPRGPYEALARELEQAEREYLEAVSQAEWCAAYRRYDDAYRALKAARVGREWVG